MSKWVAKRDDGNHGHDEGRHRLDRNGKGLGKDAGAAARQAGEVRRLIRLAAQEARGDPRRKSQSEEVNGFKFQVGPPVGSSSAPEAWEAGYEGYWNDWGASWSEWGGWQSRDWKSSKGSSKGYHKGTPSWNYAEPKDAWQEWDWEEDLWDEGSEWDEYITVKDSTVRVELSGAELGDADLKELMQYLDEYMERYVDENGGHYNLNIDLSCNSYVTDNGVSSHLVPFLQKWPVCQRLKLYKNALGDPTLKALSNWVADGYAQELHLSDLSGKVSSDAVLHLLKEIHGKQNYPWSNGKGKCPLWLRLEHNGISDVDGLLEKAQSLGISVTLVDKADLGRVRPGGKGKDSKDPNTAIHLVMFRPQERRRGKGHAHHEEHEDSTDGYSRPTSPPDYFKGQEEEDDAYKEKKGGKGKDAKFGKTAPTAKPLTASDLQMGAASYRTQMSKHPGAPNQLAQAKAKQGKIDIGSAAAFPSLGGPEKPEAAPSWGPNLQAAVAWGSAPTAVFAAPKPQPKPISPVLGPTPKEVPVQEMKEKEKPGERAALGAAFGAGKLPAPVGAAGAAPTEAPQRPPPIGADVRSLKGFSAPPQQAARDILGAIGAPLRPSSPVAPLTPPGAAPEEGGTPEVRSWQAPTAPPSSPPDEAAKPKPMAVPLPSLPPSVAPMVEPERPKLSPPTEPPQAAPAAPATPAAPAAPAENVLRRMPNAPSKPAPPAPVPMPAPQVAPLAPAPQVAPVVAPTAPPSMPPEVAARVAPAPTQPVMAPPSQAPRTAPQVPPKVAPQTPPHVPEQPGRRKVVEEDFAAIYEVPGDMVWKPLSYAEKNILKARKKIREVEKIEEAYALKGKLEPGQLAKVQRKAELEQELRVYEQRSHSQGGRNLHELEQAEQCRKTHERYEHAATYVQKVMRKCLVKKRLPEFQEEAKVRRAERDHAAKQIQKVIRTYQSKLQAHKARLEAMESTEAEEVKENLSPDLPEAVPESWEGSTFSEKVKHAPPAAAAPAPPAPPAPVGPFGFRLPPPGTVTRRDVGQANSSWQEAEDQHPVNPAATFLQRIGHDWQEPQEPPPEPPNDAWNANDFLAPPVAVDEPQRSEAESSELPIEAAPEVPIEAEAPMEEVSQPSQRAELEVPMPSVTSSVEVERTEEKKKEETQIAAEGSTLSKFLRRVVGASAADVAPAERRTEAQAELEPPASAPAPPPAPPPAPAEVPHEPPAVAVAPSAAPATPATPATPALPPQVAGFSKFFQRISGNTTAEKEDKEETKVIEKEVVQSEISRSQEGREREPPSEDEDGEKVQEVHKIDHKYVGLVIGKDGSTIKSFKKQSGASIEIDQTLPPGMPRMVIYRGTKKQVASARKLVDGIVLRAKEEEKAAGAPGTSGRDKDEKGPQDGRTDLPLWRRGKPGEDEKAFAERRKKEWHKPKEIEAAPSGSLTGLSSASMRPAWMRPKTEQEEKFVDKCIWSEQKYSRGLLLQAKQKILKMKAYEVPEEMMTMTTGPRPKHRKEKDGDEEDEEERRERKRKAKEAKEAAKAAAREENHQEQAVEASKEPEAKHEVPGGQRPAARTSYENLPGDSKEMLKLKKKLREIQKIEDSMAAGESVEPLQASKVHKKEAYLEELHFLESIVNEGEMEA